jgi:RNA polymerase sigma factor (sigma-70 family)
MRAEISAQAGLALVQTDAGAFLYSIDDLDAPRPIAPAEIGSLMRGTTDVLSADVADTASAVSLLTTAWSSDRLLQMLLILLRSDVDHDIREAAAATAGELMANDDARRFALNRLYSHPMTDDGDLPGAIAIASRARQIRVATPLRELQSDQPVIAMLTATWRAALATLPEPGRAGRLRRLFEQHAVFHALARAEDAARLKRLELSLRSKRILLDEPGAEAILRRLSNVRERALRSVAEGTLPYTGERGNVPPSTTDSAEGLYLENLAAIERIAGFAARRNHLGPDETEEFAQEVQVRLLEDDYATVRKFEGRMSFTSYLVTVIGRLAQQYRDEQWGKWRPSAEARRLGAKAITLERLITRDGFTFDEAVKVLTTPGGSEYTVAELDAIYLRLPARNPRPVVISGDVPSDAVVVEADAYDRLDREDRERSARKTALAIDELLEKMDAEDRRILQMRFWHALTVPDIARRMHLDQKKVYKRLDRVLSMLRHALQSAGVTPRDIANFTYEEPRQNEQSRLIQDMYDRWNAP